MLHVLVPRVAPPGWGSLSSWHGRVAKVTGVSIVEEEKKSIVGKPNVNRLVGRSNGQAVQEKAERKIKVKPGLLQESLA